MQEQQYLTALENDHPEQIDRTLRKIAAQLHVVYASMRDVTAPSPDAAALRASKRLVLAIGKIIASPKSSDYLVRESAGLLLALDHGRAVVPELFLAFSQRDTDSGFMVRSSLGRVIFLLLGDSKAVVKTALQHAKSGSVDLRCAALTILGHPSFLSAIPNSAVSQQTSLVFGKQVGILSRFLHDREPRIRLTTLDTLFSLLNGLHFEDQAFYRTALPALNQLLMQTTSDQEKQRAAAILRCIPSPITAALPGIRVALLSATATAQMELVQALRKAVDSDLKGVENTFQRDLSSKDTAIRRATANQITMVPQLFVHRPKDSLLSQALDDTDPIVRLTIARSLPTLSQYVLVQMSGLKINDPDPLPPLRALVSKAIVSIRDQDPALTKTLEEWQKKLSGVLTGD